MKESERIIRNERIREYAKTHTFKETAAEFGLNKYTIRKICAGMRNGYVNQYAPNGFNPEETVSRYLKETGSEFDYISGYTSSSGKVLLRCQKCGTEIERSMETIRHGTKVRCHVCDPRKKYANKAEYNAAMQAKRNAYNDRVYKKLTVSLPRDLADRLDDSVAAAGISKRQYVINIIEAAVK